MSVRGTVLGLLLLGTLAVGAGYVLAFTPAGAGSGAGLLVAAGTGVALSAAMALGALKDGGLGGLLPSFAFVLLVVGGGLSALFLLPATDPADPTLILGLPPRAALLLYGVGLLPLFVIPFAYARTFERFHLGEEDLERVRAAARADVGRGFEDPVEPTGASADGGSGPEEPVARDGSPEEGGG